MIPQSLFARTALLIAAAILVFSIIAWQAIIWTTLLPAAASEAFVLTQRANQAITAHRNGQPPPAGARFETVSPTTMEPRFGGPAIRTYMQSVRAGLQANLGAPEAHVHRFAGPSEIWVRTAEIPAEWLVLTWRIAGPHAPLATIFVLAAAALLALGAAAFSARRLTAPLAELAAAAARIAEGERAPITGNSGPSEVRSLAAAFESMSHRLAEQEEQRELMLGGISHDLRTPLARLRVAVELLSQNDKELTDEMVANIEEMDRMVGQFLHYVRANYKESPTIASLDDIVRQSLAIYGGDQRVRLELGAAARCWFAADTVRHSLLNLVQNALEYGRPPVVVRTTAPPLEIRLEVLDHGAGLSESEWRQALRPFHRLGKQPAGTHTGLGLAMLERLVRVGGGSLLAAQTVEGFAVTVRLPAEGVRPETGRDPQRA